MKQATPGQIKQFFNLFWQKLEKHNWSREWFKDFFSSGILSMILDVKNPSKIDTEKLSVVLGLKLPNIQIAFHVIYDPSSLEENYVEILRLDIPRNLLNQEGGFSRDEVFEFIDIDFEPDYEGKIWGRTLRDFSQIRYAQACVFCAQAFIRESPKIPKSLEKYKIIFPGITFFCKDCKRDNIGESRIIVAEFSVASEDDGGWVLRDRCLSQTFNPKEYKVAKVVCTSTPKTKREVHSSGRLGSTFDGA